MKNVFNGKNISLFLASLLLCVTLASCADVSVSDWEDVLPTANTTVKTTVTVDDVTTAAPITINVPEITETTPKKTELATTTTTEATTTVPTTTEAATTTTSAKTTQNITDIPSVPAAQLTETTTTTVPARAITNTPIFNPFENYIGNAEEPYVYNDPLVRPYAYYQLSEIDKKRYDFVVDNIENYTEGQIKVPDEAAMSTDDYKRIYQLVYDVEHRLFHIGLNMNYMEDTLRDEVAYITLNYAYTKDEYLQMTQQVEAAADEIVSRITPNMTEYDIVKLFYDEIATCPYDITAPNLRDIYGVLVDKKAVCGGFAKTFSYLCDKVGINSLTISGDDGDIPHMWNMVQIGGEWYHIDPTNSVIEFEDGSFEYRYDYFNVTDEVINRGRTLYPTEYDYPVANSTEYNYFHYNGLVATTYDEAVEIVKADATRASNTGRKWVAISASNEALYNEICNNFFNSYEYSVLDILQELNFSLQNTINTNEIIYNPYNDTRSVIIFLEYN